MLSLPFGGYELRRRTVPGGTVPLQTHSHLRVRHCAGITRPISPAISFTGLACSACLGSFLVSGSFTLAAVIFVLDLALTWLFPVLLGPRSLFVFGIFLAPEHIGRALLYAFVLLIQLSYEKISPARFSGELAACSQATSTASVARSITAAAIPDRLSTAVPPITAKARNIAANVLLIGICLLLIVGLAAHRPAGLYMMVMSWRTGV